MAALEAVKKYFPDSIGSFQKHIEEIPKIDPEKIESYTLFLDILAEFIQSNEMFQFKKMTLGAFIKKYIKENLDSQITLESIALSLHCSTSTVVNAFRKEFGKTIIQYVTEKKMERACELLKDKSHSIKEIALKCGYSEPGYFTKTFTKYYGISPTDWRLRVEN